MKTKLLRFRFTENCWLDEDYVRQYKTFILPFPISISEEIMKKLADWVRKGGNLISEAAVGRINEHAFCNRGELSPVAAKLFGVEHKNITMVQEPKYGRRWTVHERTWGEYLEPAMLSGCGPLKGKRLRANVYIETFRCTDSKPCLKYKTSIAGIFRKVEKGTAWLLGTFAGHNGTAYRDKETRALILNLLNHCGVTAKRKDKLFLQKRISEGKEAWFFFNPTDKVIAEQVNVKGWKNVIDLMGEKLERKSDLVSLSVKGLDVRVLVLSKQRGKYV